MNVRSIVGTLLWAALLGLVLALARGENQVVSVQLWLAGFASYLAVLIFLRLISVLPSARGDLVGLWPRPSRSRDVERDRRTGDLRSASSLVARAATNERVHQQQLRPRLTALAAHFLPVQYGLDPTTQPDRVAQLLGDLAWLIDPSVNHRSPTITEIDDFLAVLDGSKRRSVNEVL